MNDKQEQAHVWHAMDIGAVIETLDARESGLRDSEAAVAVEESLHHNPWITIKEGEGTGMFSSGAQAEWVCFSG